MVLKDVKLHKNKRLKDIMIYRRLSASVCLLFSVFVSSTNMIACNSLVDFAVYELWFFRVFSGVDGCYTSG